MPEVALVLSATIAYLLAASRLAGPILRGPTPGREAKPVVLGLGAIGVLLHALILYRTVFTGTGLNLAFFNALSLFAWVISAIVVTVSLLRPLENVAFLTFPLAAASMLLAFGFPAEHLVTLDRGFGFELHLGLAIVAYSLISVAAVQAVLLAYQERRLRRRRLGGGTSVLPPLQTMESLLFQLIAAGFFVLSLAIVSGVMFVEDLFAQRVAHKTILTVIAWVTLGTLLWGRWRFGWRGRVATRWALGGFIALMLAYFGSKFVVEMILHR
jgi:ABC-type uncharacterized transport system permease subunit